MVRLQKLLAAAGLGSRRAIEQWIRAGRVTIGGRLAQLGDRAGPGDEVRLDGKKVELAPEAPAASREVLLYNKPLGELTTRRDPEGRPTVFDQLPPPRQGRWISVGRLDVNTSGLLLFTTDGELAHRLMHPSAEVEREYRVRVRGVPSREALAALERGVELEDGLARFERMVAERQSEADAASSHSWYRVVIKEGRNREVRRMWRAVGCEVSRLVRVRYGPLELPDDLRAGTWRRASALEIAALAGTVLAASSSSPSTHRVQPPMQVLVSSDHTVTSSEALTSRVSAAVTHGLAWWADRITRVEVHLSDVSNHKRGKTGKRCVMEAHVGGLKPVAVHDEADVLGVAIDGSIRKLQHVLGHELGRLKATAGPGPTPRQLASMDELEQLERLSKKKS